MSIIVPAPEGGRKSPALRAWPAEPGDLVRAGRSGVTSVVSRWVAPRPPVLWSLDGGASTVAVERRFASAALGDVLDRGLVGLGHALEARSELDDGRQYGPDQLHHADPLRHVDDAGALADALGELIQSQVERVGLAHEAGHAGAELAEHRVGVGAVDQVGLDPRRM